MGLKIDAKDFLANMSAIKQRSMFAVEKVGQNAAARMEGEAKRNARWTDRTGLARQTITGYSGVDPEVNADPNKSTTSNNKGKYPMLGMDYGTYPRARTFTFGVNIEF